MAERVRVRGITDDEGQRLLRLVRRASGSVVTWRRAQVVLLSAQGMDLPGIAGVVFTSADRVRDVIHDCNADGHVTSGESDPSVVICMDEFGPLNLQLHPGEQWAPSATGEADPGAPRRRRRRATCTRPNGVRHLMAGYDLSTNKLHGHVKGRTEFLALCRYLRSLHPPGVRIAIVLDDFSPHHDPPLRRPAEPPRPRPAATRGRPQGPNRSRGDGRPTRHQPTSGPPGAPRAARSPRSSRRSPPTTPRRSAWWR